MSLTLADVNGSSFVAFIIAQVVGILQTLLLVMAFPQIVFVMLLFHILYILIYNDCKRVTNVS